MIKKKKKTSDATFGPNGQFHVGRAECSCFGVVSAKQDNEWYNEGIELREQG
jgi:hypothetical protein